MNKQMAKQTGIFMQQNIANKLKKKKKRTDVTTTCMNLLPPTVSLCPSGCPRQAQGLSLALVTLDEAIKYSPQFHTKPMDTQIARSKGHGRGYFLVSFKNQSSVACSLNLSLCILNTDDPRVSRLQQ